jgi:hypothetical protein
LQRAAEGLIIHGRHSKEDAVMWVRLASAVALSALLGGCSAQQQDDGAEPVANDAAKGTVFKEMAGTLDKARGVEDTAAQQQQQLDRALEQAEGK